MGSRADILLSPNGRFSLAATVAASGTPLPPWTWSGGARPVLRRVEARPDGRLYLLEIRPGEQGVVLRVVGPDAAEAEVLIPLAARVRRALGLDLDLRAVQRICRREATLRPLLRDGLGPLLRGTSIFEDVVDAVTRTHAGERAPAVLAYLTQALGRRLRGTRLRTFPTPAALAAGARAACVAAGHPRLGTALAKLGRSVAAGAIDLGALELARGRITGPRLRALPGVRGRGIGMLRLTLGDFAWGAAPPDLPPDARPWRALIAHWLAHGSRATAAAAVVSRRPVAPRVRATSTRARGTPRPRPRAPRKPRRR